MQPQVHVGEELVSGLYLWGYRLPPQEMRPGERPEVVLWWRCTRSMLSDYESGLVLMDSTGRVVWERWGVIVPGHPTTEWEVGEVNRAVQSLALPPSLRHGSYDLVCRIRHRDHTEVVGEVALKELLVTAYARSYAEPAMSNRLDIAYDAPIMLLGYDISQDSLRAGECLTVTLHWRAEGTMSQSYKVSVQVLTSDDRVVAQDDSVPVRWTYPTTMWVEGEYVTDEHELCLPANVIDDLDRVLVVIYDERTLDRLDLRDHAADAVVLDRLWLEP